MTKGFFQREISRNTALLGNGFQLDEFNLSLPLFPKVDRNAISTVAVIDLIGNPRIVKCVLIN